MDNIKRTIQIKEALIDELYPDNKRNELLKQNDSKELRRLCHFVDEGISADELLECIDFELIKQLKEGKDVLSKLDLDSIINLGIVARRMKLADMIYKMAIGNLKIDDDEFIEGLEMLKLQIEEDEPIHELKLVNKEAK